MPESTLPSFISSQVLDASYFFLNLVPSRSDEFVVTCGGIEKCAPDYRLEREDFGFVGIEYVISGRARATIEGKSIELRPGSLFGYKPDAKLRIENSGVYPLTKYFVDLAGGKAERLFEEGPLGQRGALDLAGVRWVEETFRQMVKFGAQGGPKAERSCAMLAELLLLQMGESELESTESESPAYQSYRRCKGQIQANYREINSVAELSEHVSLDQAYIARLFKKYDDESPYRNLIRLKMNHAARLLLRENSSIKVAAVEIGFDDASHFSRVFKKTYGVSPAFFPKSVKRT